MTIFVLVFSVFTQVPAGLHVWTNAATFKNEALCLKAKGSMIATFDKQLKDDGGKTHYQIRCVESEVK